MRPLHPCLQGRAGHRSPEFRRPKRQDCRHDRLQQPARSDGLHPLRPVQSRLSDGRDHGKGRHAARSRCLARPEEARHRAGRPRRARLLGRRIPPAARRHRHGTDGRRLEAPRLRPRLRHELRRRPHDHGRRARIPASPGERRHAPHDDLVQPRLGQLRRKALQRLHRPPVDGEIPHADLRRCRQDLLPRAGRHPRRGHRDRLRHALHGEEVRSGTP